MSVKTPLVDSVKALALELEAGWGLKADAPDGLAGHSCGKELSREVGRILRNCLSRGEAKGAEVLIAAAPEMLAALRSIAGDGIGAGRNPQMMIDVAAAAIAKAEAS